jgi:hypothetical protein
MFAYYYHVPGLFTLLKIKKLQVFGLQLHTDSKYRSLSDSTDDSLRKPCAGCRIHLYRVQLVCSGGNRDIGGGSFVQDDPRMSSAGIPLNTKTNIVISGVGKIAQIQIN